MKARLFYLLKYYLYWIVFFLIQKPVFMVWQYGLMGEVRGADWLLVPWHGLPLDLSVAAYVAGLVGVCLCVSFWVSWRIIKPVIDSVTGLMLFVSLWIFLGDNGCFPSWGYHLNKDVFTYLASPKEALACAPWWVWLLAVIAFAVLFLACGWGYMRWMKRENEQLANATITQSSQRIGLTLGMLLVTGLLFLPIRGSVTVSTMNTGRVYYSANRMLNLAAVNPVFNLIENVTTKDAALAKYCYMSDEEMHQTIAAMCSDASAETDTLFTTRRPDIVLCILESFSKNAMDAGAMPQLSMLAKEGIFCSNMYAASYRTDRGLMAILGAFPGCAAISLMTMPDKAGRLPQIGQVLKREGYQLKFFYGGDEDFTCMRSFLTSGGFEDRIADRDFPISDRLSKWGVPDHIVMARAAEEIRHHNNGGPYFDVVLTLSSHEPFEVPYHHSEDPYLNAIAYTDSCLGALVDTLRNSPRWDSTIVVMVADHGFAYPPNLQSFDPLHYRIPLVIAGGAVRGAREITTCCQQVDWVPTILHQMGLSAEPFVFARNILDTEAPKQAYYNFVDGFALVSDSALVVYDADAKQVVQGEDTSLLHQAQAIAQYIMTTISML